MSLDSIIIESLNNYLVENLLFEDFFDEAKKKKHEPQKVRLNMDTLKDAEKYQDKKTKKKKKFKKNAIKKRGGLRGDFDIEDDETYNRNIDDQEQSTVKSILKNGYINISRVAQDLYPDHTKEGAQSQLNKKLNGDKSDSGSTYKLKAKELKKLRQIIARHLKN